LNLADAMSLLSSSALFEAIVQGGPAVQRRGMAKAITLLESTRADHREQADELLTRLLPQTGRSFRLASVAFLAWAKALSSKSWVCT